MGRCPNERFPELVVCYEHATKDALALLARRAIEHDERAMFLLLFYRERVGRLASTLIEHADYKKIIRKKHKKSILGEYDWSTEQVGQFLLDFIRRAEDDTRCNDICKSMYFCDLKKGHRGGHSEGPGALGPW